MKLLLREIEANFDKFSEDWKYGLETVITSLDSERAKYLQSYNRLVSLQAWRADFLETRISADSLAFFLEAQNDMLVSHVLARCGSWRSALKSLRSAIENICFCLYYMDHPVELQQWHKGTHKPGFTATHDYLTNHPLMDDVAKAVNPLQILKEEYATLSRAVHASSKSFRMTSGVKETLLWSAEKPSLGSWTTRERKTIIGLNLLLLVIFREELHGTKLPNLKKAVSLAIPATTRVAVKNSLKVTLPEP